MVTRFTIGPTIAMNTDSISSANDTYRDSIPVNKHGTGYGPFCTTPRILTTLS